MWTHYTLLRNMVRPLSRVDTNIRPPVGGSNKGCSRYAAHFPPAFRPPPRAAPRRGKIPPAPLGRACPPPAWPERPTRLPPPICRPEGKGKRSAQAEGRRAVRASGEISKSWAVRSAAGGSGGRAPRCSGGVVNRVEPVGGQWSTRSVVHAVHGRPRLSTPERATGRVLRTEREGKRRKPAPVLDPPLHLCISSPALVVAAPCTFLQKSA